MSILVALILSNGSRWEHLASLQPAKTPSSTFPGDQTESDAAGVTLYLPLVFSPDPFLQNAPIWAHTNPPAVHEVVLFRRTFTLEEMLTKSRLDVFADTRYEAWIDGAWIGRGPARFSQNLREYDVYELGSLPAGNHVIAILVQWSPNNRRSESITPLLKADFAGSSASGQIIFERTDAQWKALLSDAWRADAPLVHSWGLIGSTEILDLSRLPSGWNQPGFDDASWPPAVVQNNLDAINYHNNGPPSIFASTNISSTKAFELSDRVSIQDNNSSIVYQPRSIPMEVNVPITATFTDGGLLSPGYLMGELVQPISDPYALPLNASTSVTLSVETLTETLSNKMNTIQLDGNSLSWHAAGTLRPDVFVSSTQISAGRHQLLFSNVPAQGTTFSVSSQNIDFESLPFQQGVNAGRRLLLADPVSAPGQVVVTPTIGGVSLSLKQLPAYAVLDLGRTVHGRLSADVHGPAGTVIDIGWDERLLTATKRPLPYPGSLHPQWNQVDSWVLDGSERELTTLDTRAGRYVLIAAWGLGSIHLDHIRIVEERFPLIQTGDFHSVDPLLNRIWQTGVDTLYPNMTDSYTDTPWRERGQWWGDAYVEDHINRVAFGETRLLRRGLLFMADALTQWSAPGMAPNNNGLHMIDYTMLWVHSLNEYLQFTGDIGLIEKVYPELVTFMDHLVTLENPSTGLIDLPQQHWSSTAYVEMLGYHSRYGQSTAINALYYSTLLNASSLADRMGDLNRAFVWNQNANHIREQVNTLLYIPDEHRYLTNIYQGVLYPPTPQAQAWALSYGLTPDIEVQQVSNSLLELLSTDPAKPNVEIYGMNWVLSALGRSGRIPEAISIIKNYWGRMLDLGATTWWEGFNGNRNYAGSLSHGWGGSPTWFLTNYVLGAQRTGMNAWLVKPSLAGVSYAAGQIPLQDGVLHVQWESDSCVKGRITISSPPGSEGELVIPDYSPGASLYLNGNLIMSPGKPPEDGIIGLPDGLHFSLRDGVYTFVLQGSCMEDR